MKKLTYPLFVLLVTFVLTEVSLRFISKRQNHIDYLFGKRSYFLPPFQIPKEVPQVDTTTWFKYNVYDAMLGWSIGKLGSQPPYYSDNFGYRCSEQKYDSLITTRVFHRDTTTWDIVCLGNSFTHGDEVTFEQTWPYQLEQLTGMKTLNLGVGGYGIDQAYLRYKHVSPKTKLVILGMVAGDLDRATTQIYNLTFGGLKTKPLFVFNKGQAIVKNQPAVFGETLLEQLENPETSELLKRERYWPDLFVHRWYDVFFTMRTIRAFSVWGRHRSSIYNTPGPDLDNCISILKEAKISVEQNNARFVVLLLDNLNTFIDWETKQGDPWEIFKARLQEEGIEYWYYGDSFYKDYKNNPDDVINHGLVHYTPKANHELAEFVAKNLSN